MIDINLLPQKKKQKKRGQKNAIVLFVLLLSAGFLLASYHVFLLSQPLLVPSSPVHSVQRKPFKIPFKFIGYLEDDHRVWAIVLLRNGETRDVQVGSVIAGNVHVVSIDRKKMIVEISGRKVSVTYRISENYFGRT